MKQQQLEADRLESLRTYDLDAGLVDLGLDGLVALAASACAAAVAYVTVVEAEVVRLLAVRGTTERTLPRRGTFCAWVVDNAAPLSSRTRSRTRASGRTRGCPAPAPSPVCR